MKNKSFNIIITGVGGQGAISLTRIISKAAYLSGLDSKASEVHGLAQRGGHVSCHVRFGKKIHSPLVKQADADLVISTEPLEVLRCLHYVSKKTAVVTSSSKIIPISVATDKQPYPELEEIIKQIKKFTNKVVYRDASEILKKEVNTTVPLNIYMLGLAYHQKLIPLKKEKLLQAIQETFGEKYFDLNKKVFQLAEK